MHHRNSLFYKTCNGARVGDLYISLIETCDLNKVSPFDSLNQLQLHAADVTWSPERCMPWNRSENARPAANAA